MAKATPTTTTKSQGRTFLRGGCGFLGRFSDITRQRIEDKSKRSREDGADVQTFLELFSVSVLQSVRLGLRPRVVAFSSLFPREVCFARSSSPPPPLSLLPSLAWAAREICSQTDSNRRDRRSDGPRLKMEVSSAPPASAFPISRMIRPQRVDKHKRYWDTN